MRNVHVTNIGVSSMGKVWGIANAVIGLVYGALFTLAAIGGVAGTSNSWLRSLGVSLGFAVFSVVIFPAIFFVVGWVQGVIAAAILNVAFRETKGLELQIEESKK